MKEQKVYKPKLKIRSRELIDVLRTVDRQDYCNGGCQRSGKQVKIFGCLSFITSREGHYYLRFPTTLITSLRS